MPSTKEIRRRIKSVKNIQQITKAMKMVAAARLRRAQERAMSSQPYTSKVQEALSSVARSIAEEVRDEVVHPLLEVREVNKKCYLILGADKGLAGAYTSNLLKEVTPQVSGKDDVALVTVGRKVRDFYRRRNYEIDSSYLGISEKPSFKDASTIASFLAEKYIQAEYDEIYIVYTHFYSPAHVKPVTIKLLPIADAGSLVPNEAKNDEAVTAVEANMEYIFEPNPKEVLSFLVPKYIETVIYSSLLQAAASELGSRMAAMSLATDNAQELISELTLYYNKVRQASITTEITEIVSGAEALK
ncbi:ATP synthase F1 subunit gamma [Selenomonadales bacterium OttesenSCG-928-I06]|nr:ATP synthase F1 subunit gamma [Selenomonadales bacterium OttesenSCG-928-I06]